MLKRLFCLAAVALATAAVAVAQFEAGSLSGIITDPSGAVVPGTTVEVRGQSTNVIRTTKATEGGQYNFVNLAPGAYSITAKQQGFKSQTQNFQLNVGQRAQIDVVLQLPTASESVAVTSEAASTVETASSDLGNITGSQQVADLPLNSRNFTQLVGLSAGSNMHGHSNNSQALGYTIGRGANGAVVNGNPGEDTIYLFDGIQSVNNDIQAVIFFPVIDFIQEFKVQTSGAPAAYGGGPSMINLTTRSGTNQFHGTFYEFVRNSDLDAKNYFDSHTKPITPFHMNQFGANIGGPFIIPHLINGRNKMFFFGDWEGRRVSQALTYISTVPTASFLAGDFSALSQTLIDPVTGLAFPGNPALGTTKNYVNPNRWDPSSTKLVALYKSYAVPNNGAANALVNNFLFSGAVINNVNQGDVRIDYRTDKASYFGRFSKEDPITVNPGYLPAPAIGGGPSRPGTTPVPGEQIVLGYGRSIGSNKYYEARLGWSRMNEAIIIANNTKTDLSTQYGIPGANTPGIPGLTNFAITGQVGLGDGFGNLRKIDNNWEVDQAFTLIRGRHELKAGFDFMSRRQPNYDPLYPAGNFTFSGVYTGYSLADFLLGHPISSELDSAEFLNLKRNLISFYVQDNYRVTSKLVLEFGIRDDMVTPWTEKHDRLAGFDPTANGGAGAEIPVGTAPFSGRSTFDGRYTNIGPRLGFSYALNGKTVIRGGGGIYYANENLSGNPYQANAPFHGSYIVTNASGSAGFAAAAPISAGFPAARPTLYPTAGTTVYWYPRAYKNATSNEYSIDIQRQLSSHDMLSVAYSGQTATHVLIQANINLPTPGAGAVNARRPFPGFATINHVCQCANSIFNSLQVTYRNQITNVLNVLGSYAYAHSIDNSSGAGNTFGIQNPRSWWNTYRGNSDWDMRHSFVLSWTYDLPFGRNKLFANGAHGLEEVLIGGWQLNSIDSFQTGIPFTPTMNTSGLNTGGSVQYPNRIGSGKLSKQTAQAWFNIADFVAPAQYAFGNSGRNILFGPGTKQVDASLFKNFGLGADASRRFQFRAEVFNLFNTPQFNNPNAAIGNGAAGTITSAGTPQLFQRTSREIQLAAKLYW